MTTIFFSLFFYYYYLLYNTVLVLPYINTHLPWVYTCSPSWTPLPPPSPYHPSGSSQCTSPKLPVSCIEPGLVIRFLYDIIHVFNDHTFFHPYSAHVYKFLMHKYTVTHTHTHTHTHTDSALCSRCLQVAGDYYSQLLSWLFNIILCQKLFTKVFFQSNLLKANFRD